MVGDSVAGGAGTTTATHVITFAEKLARIPHYEAGSASVDGAEREGARDVAQLASNESPYAPVEEVVEAVRAAAAGVNRYPDPAARSLRAALGDRYGYPAARIAVGNGSCEILLAAAEALLEPGSSVVYAWPSFSMYPHLAAISGAQVVTVPLDGDDRHDLEALRLAITDATRLLLVCNPNNPTSTHLPSAAIGEFLEKVPSRVLVILDEAYIEFQVVEDPDTTLALLDRFPNLVLLRTFSKVYGLAGLRVGYALGSEEFRQAVDRVRQPFAVNQLAQAAATEALRHQDDVVRRVERNAVERLWVGEELERLGLDWAESQANFFWLDLGDRDESEVVRDLGRRGVAVRAGEGLGGPGHIRVTYGTRAENERLVEALRAIFQ
jgi:histidinol-phosphate aminotransferase